MAMPAGMMDLLESKYAILKQQADANTLQARTGEFNAQTQRTVGNAAALLDTTRSNLMPAESAATVAKMGSETALNRETAKYLGPETLARIAKMRADTDLTTTQDLVERRMGLRERTADQSSLDRIMGGRLPTLQW